MKRIAGFSLISLFMGLAVSLIWAGFLMTLIVQQLHFYRYQKAIAMRLLGAMQAHHILYDAIVLAGRLGCHQLSESFPQHSASSCIGLDHDAIRIVSGAETGDYDGCQIPTHRIDTDLIFTEGITEDMSVPYQKINDELVIKKRLFKKGDCLLLSNCLLTQWRIVQSAYSASGNQVLTLNNVLPPTFDKSYSLFHWHRLFYFIRKTKRKNSRGFPIYALYRRSCHGVSQELVPGIEQLKGVIQNGKVELHLLVGTIYSFNSAPENISFEKTSSVNYFKRFYKQLTIIARRPASMLRHLNNNEQ